MADDDSSNNKNMGYEDELSESEIEASKDELAESEIEEGGDDSDEDVEKNEMWQNVLNEFKMALGHPTEGDDMATTSSDSQPRHPLTVEVLNHLAEMPALELAKIYQTPPLELMATMTRKVTQLYYTSIAMKRKFSELSNDLAASNEALQLAREEADTRVKAARDESALEIKKLKGEVESASKKIRDQWVIINELRPGLEASRVEREEIRSDPDRLVTAKQEHSGEDDLGKP